MPQLPKLEGDDYPSNVNGFGMLCLHAMQTSLANSISGKARAFLVGLLLVYGILLRISVTVLSHLLG